MAKERVLDYANKISRTKKGKKDGITPDRPEYKILEPVVTEEMAEVGMALEFRVPKTAKMIAEELKRPVEEVEKLLWELALCGAAFVSKMDGVDHYWHDIWVPGHMEMMANHRENVAKHPEIAYAFDAYGKVRGPKAAGIFPVGTGPMRVIPIEQSIEGETKRASYEEVSNYLEESHRFSVSDCSCRTSREVMGEGCGHLKEDMCIQLDHAAEYYIRTGRGREITREEAYEIIHRAEENGLMHSIPNLDGPGKTHAICNCCGCACFAMRIAAMYKNPDMVRSNYISKVDEDKCVACGECVETCPTNALKLGQKLCIKEPLPEKEVELPYDTEWGEDKWNQDYRLNKEVVTETGTSPCKAECPAHIGIQGYIKLAAEGKYMEALELIKEENPLPAVCGRICPKNCESACTRSDLDDPIAIDDIKKFIAEKELSEKERFIPKKKGSHREKIAVIGSGPGGLSCAYFLAVQGYPVTVFEKEKELGGMLTLGIPNYRLEKEVILSEIEVLKALGVEFKTGVEIGKDQSIKDLRGKGYKAFYLAIGAQKGRRIGLEGEEAEGVLSGVDFLRAVNLDKKPEINGPVVVIGGGNVAIDVARTALRLSEQDVNMYCLESEEEMPALEEEIHEAKEEAVNIYNGWGPKRILTESGKVTGVEFVKCTQVMDQQGRFSPVFDESVTKVVETEHVYLSVGQEIQWGELLEGTAVKKNNNNTAIADGITFQTDEPDIFVGGDVLTGPKFAIDAIAQGKEGAISIHRFVHKGQSLTLGRTNRDYRPLDKENLDLAGYDQLPRQRMLVVEGEKSKKTFQDLRGVFTEEQLKKETERCLDCGATEVDEFMCVGCGSCVTKCKFDAISLVRKYDETSVEFADLKPMVIKYALRRKLRIKGKEMKKKFSKVLNRA